MGGGSFGNQDTLFVVEEPRANPTDGVISLRNVANSSRYIAMSAKGDVKARNVSESTSHILFVGIYRNVLCFCVPVLWNLFV